MRFGGGAGGGKLRDDGVVAWSVTMGCTMTLGSWGASGSWHMNACAQKAHASTSDSGQQSSDCSAAKQVPQSAKIVTAKTNNRRLLISGYVDRYSAICQVVVARATGVRFSKLGIRDRTPGDALGSDTRRWLASSWLRAHGQRYDF